MNQTKKLAKEIITGLSKSGSRFKVLGNLAEFEARADTMETEESQEDSTHGETQRCSQGTEG